MQYSDIKNRMYGIVLAYYSTYSALKDNDIVEDVPDLQLTFTTTEYNTQAFREIWDAFSLIKSCVSYLLEQTNQNGFFYDDGENITVEWIFEPLTASATDVWVQYDYQITQVENALKDVKTSLQAANIQ